MASSAISRRVRSSLNSVSSILKALRRNRIAFAGFIILLIYVGIAVVAAAHLLPKIPPPRVGYSNIYAPPSLNDFPWYLLGTDYTGRPLLLILFYGTPSILLVAFIAALITVVVGLVLGLISGYIGGNVDVLISTIIDIALTLPTYVLALILVVVLPISLTNDPLVLAGILSVTSWAGLARAIRSQVLSLKRREFIDVAKTIGFSNFRIMFGDLARFMAPYIFINLLVGMIGALYGYVGLAFLGLLPLSSENWGVQLNEAVSAGGAIYTSRGVASLWSSIVIIVLLQLSLISLTSATDEIFNPALRRAVEEESHMEEVSPG